jgi:hypothetical protein
MTTTSTALGNIVWTRRDLPAAALSHRGHLRLLQGAPLRDLFLPFLLLRGDPSPIWRVPFEVRNAVFAEVHSAPETLSPEQVAFELLKNLTKDS